MSTVTAFRMNPVQPMTVEVLRAILEDQPANAVVILARDAEENDHKPLLELYAESSRVLALNGSTASVSDGPVVVLVPYD